MIASMALILMQGHSKKKLALNYIDNYKQAISIKLVAPVGLFFKSFFLVLHDLDFENMYGLTILFCCCPGPPIGTSEWENELL